MKSKNKLNEKNYGPINNSNSNTVKGKKAQKQDAAGKGREKPRRVSEHLQGVDLRIPAINQIDPSKELLNDALSGTRRGFFAWLAGEIISYLTGM